MRPVRRGDGCCFLEGGYGLFRGLPEGVAAGFTTRRSEESVEARRLAQGLSRALGAPDARLALARQVHGRAILLVESTPARTEDAVVGDGDALVTGEENVLLGIQSADCVPVLLADAKGPWIAAVHAGWRGSAARILDGVLDFLSERGAPPESLVAVIGPCISGEAYEVGPEVAAEVARAHADVGIPGSALRPGRGRKSLLDLAILDRAVLLGRGVAPERFFEAGLCTASRADLFPSYRRDGTGAGRIVTGIVRRRDRSCPQAASA